MVSGSWDQAAPQALFQAGAYLRFSLSFPLTLQPSPSQKTSKQTNKYMYTIQICEFSYLTESSSSVRKKKKANEFIFITLVDHQSEYIKTGLNILGKCFL